MRHFAALYLAAAIAAPAAAQPAPAPDTGAKLAYVIVYVADMKASVAFYREQLGLKPTFVSPMWSEFQTGSTALALHPASRENPAGTSEAAFTVSDLNGFYEARRAAGATFTGPPTAQEYGQPMTEMRTPDGGRITVGAPSKWAAPPR